MIEKQLPHPGGYGADGSEIKLRIFDDYDGLSREAAKIFFEDSGAEVKAKGYFTVALSGGKTPRGLYETLVGKGDEKYAKELPWENVHFFWGDERCVNLTHPECNYALFHNVIFTEVPLPPENIHPVPGELQEGGAFIYEEEIRSFFSRKEKRYVKIPSFDLLFLGLGSDGHTLSLFPGSSALGVQSRLVMHVREEGQAIPERITMTASLVNNSKKVVFLVTGKEKAGVLKETLQGRYDFKKYPAQSIRPGAGELIFLVDKEAAALVID